MAKLCTTGTAPKILAAQAWTELREPLDRQLSPLGLPAMDALSPHPGETVLDVGCGTGHTVLQLAERVGLQGRVVGVDVSSLMLEAAGERARGCGQIGFIEADAATLDLPAGSVDAVFSRFGVMAFAEPVAAFTNLRRLLKPQGRLAFVCWRALEENELDLLPVRAAGLEPFVDPTPFSFEAPDHIRTTLRAAGFRDVAIQAHDGAVSCGDLETTIAVVLRVGALGRILRENPALRADAEPRVRAVLAQRPDPSQLFLNAATWIVSARA